MYELEADYKEEIEFLFINIDGLESQPDMEKYQFQSGTPHLLLFDMNGEVVRQWFGTFTRDQVEVMFPAVLN